MSGLDREDSLDPSDDIKRTAKAVSSYEYYSKWDSWVPSDPVSIEEVSLRSTHS